MILTTKMLVTYSETTLQVGVLLFISPLNCLLPPEFFRTFEQMQGYYIRLHLTPSLFQNTSYILND